MQSAGGDFRVEGRISGWRLLGRVSAIVSCLMTNPDATLQGIEIILCRGFVSLLVGVFRVPVGSIGESWTPWWVVVLGLQDVCYIVSR